MIKLLAEIDISDIPNSVDDLAHVFNSVWESLARSEITTTVVTGNFRTPDGAVYRDLAFHPTARYSDETGHRYLTDGTFTFDFTQFLEDVQEAAGQSDVQEAAGQSSEEGSDVS